LFPDYFILILTYNPVATPAVYKSPL